MQLLGRITAKEQTKEPRERCVELARVIFLYRALFDCGCWLLAAVDTFPRGGLCSGYYAVCAALRYLQVWRPSLVHLNQQDALPPLDVAWAWLVARQQPIPYRALGSGNGPYATAFLFGVTSDRDRRCWAEAVAKAAAAVAADAEGVGSRAGLAGQAAWPPPLPVPGEQPWAGIGAELLQEAVELAEDMQRFSTLLRSWLRPQFLDTDFLVRAQFRYSQFLELHALNPHTVLVPTADIALMWHTHIGLHGEYARSCGELFPAPAAAPATITTTTTTTTTTMASATASAASDHAAASQTPLPDSGTGGQCQGGEGSHSEGRHSAGSHGEGSHKVGYLFSPDYLRLRGIQLEAAFAETARLYEEQYGEPYLSPDVAWIPPGEVYPAADPAGPLSALLDVFNAMPAAASDASATHLAQQVPSTRLQSPNAPKWHAAATPRAGGHALFTLWLIARTLAEGPPFPRLSVRVGQAEVRVGQVAGAAEADAAAATCCGCFGAPRRALPAERVLGLASVAQTGGSEAVGDVSAPKLSVLSDLFALAIGERIGLLYHMRLLPAWTEHPFLACIRERPGLWVPPRTVVVSPSKTSVDSTKRDGSRSAAVVVATANDSQPGGVGTTPAAPDRLVLRKEVQFEAADSEPDSPPPAGGTAPLSPPPPPQDATLNRVWEPAPSACQGGRYAVTDCERFMDSTAPLGPQLAGLAEALGGPLSVEALPSSQSGRELVAGSRRLLGRRSETASRRPRSSSMRRARDAGGGSGSSTTDAGEATRPIQDLLRKPQWLVEVRRVVRGRAEEPFDPHARGLRYTPGSATLTEGAGLGLELPVNRSRDADGAVGAGGAETARDRVADRRAVRSIADVYDLEVELQLVSAVAVVLPAAVDTSGGRRSP